MLESEESTINTEKIRSVAATLNDVDGSQVSTFL